MDDLTVSAATTSAGVRQVTVAGEIDASTIVQLDTVLSGEPPRLSPGLVVDLTRVTFIGAAGANRLVALRQRADRAAVPLQLVVDDGVVRRCLEMTRIWPTFSISEDEHSAVRAILDRNRPAAGVSGVFGVSEVSEVSEAAGSAR